MPAPPLSFTDKEDEKRKKRRKGPPPPPRVQRDPKKHSIFSNLWSGIESIPRGFYEQEEQVRHAAAKDIGQTKGLFGYAALPWKVAIEASLAGVREDERKKLGKTLRAARRNINKKDSAFTPVAKQIIQETYETTRRATGTRGTKKAKEIWHDNPVAAIGGVTVLAAPAFRAAGIGTMSRSIRAANRVPVKGGGTRAMTRTEAVKAATVESYYPGMLDRLGIEGSPFKARVSGRRTSRSPTGRASQRAFDYMSNKIDEGAIPKLGPDTPLSATRRAAAGARRADDLSRSRLVTNAMRHVSTFADYLNDDQMARIGTALGRRKDTLAARDAAVGAALHASSSVDPVEAVRLAAEDTKSILQSGKRDAHNGDIGDLAPDQREGQTVYITHGIDDDGKPIRQEAVVTGSHGDRVTVTDETAESGVRTIPNGRAHLLGPDGEGQIPLSADEIKMLERRYDHLTDAYDELISEPKLQEKFRAATQSMSDLGQMNEELGIDYFTRGLDPTGSEAMAIRERLDARRNQFLDRLGGSGSDIDYYAGLWGDLRSAMEQSGKYTDEQQFIFMSVMDRQARLWANEVEGRDPADYLASPEGANIGGIDFAKPEDLESSVNAMFQTAGERNHLVKTTTTVLISGPPKVGDLVSTPHGMGFIRRFFTEEDVGAGETPTTRPRTMVMIDMAEGANVWRTMPVDEVRVSQFPWIGHPQVDDYVMTPEGVGRVSWIDDGEAPDWMPTYTVTMFEREGAMFYDADRQTFRAGEVQRIEDPSEMGQIFHLASQEALGQENFPKKATSEQYRKALEKAGVKADEFYWMGLSRRPMLEDAVAQAEGEVRRLEKQQSEAPDYDQPSFETEILAAKMEIDKAQERLDAYDEEPDPSMLLDARRGGKSFPVSALRDAVDARAHFLDLKEALYSSDSPDSRWTDRWGTNRGSGDGGDGTGLIIRNPTVDHPYHELVLALPNSDLFRSGHFSDPQGAAPIVHIRFHEIVDNEGNRAILIDELQSDWNNIGRRGGWKEILTPHDERAAAKLRDKERRLIDMQAELERELGFTKYDVDRWFDRLVDDAQRTMNEEISVRNEARRAARLERGESHYPTPEDPDEPTLYQYDMSDRAKIEERVRADHADDPVFPELLKVRDRFARLQLKQVDARRRADAIENSSGRAGAVNRGPLVMGDAAKYLAMKRMVRWAADHGQTRIIWTRGHEQGVRYEKFDDLPLRHERDTSDMDPSDHGDDFYYPYTSNSIDLGSHHRRIDVSESQIHAMQQAAPMEIHWEDLEEYNDQFALLPEGHPADTGGHLPIAGQTSMLPDFPVFAPDPTAMVRHPRWAEVMAETNDGLLVRPIDPRWDPARFEFDYRGSTGHDSWGSWDVRITNRVGEDIYSDTVEGNFGDSYESLLDAVFTDWARTLRNYSSDTAEADIPKANQLIEILKASDTFTSEFEYAMRHVDYELDQYAWDEYVQNYHDENPGEGGAYGDFSDIRDHEPYGQRRANQIRRDIAAMKERRQHEIEQGVVSFDYDTKIRELEAAARSAERGMENKGHTQGYDRMLPQMANRMLKPYRKEADYAPVELKHGVYRGRYGTEPHGIISEEGDMHGWAMDLPKKMIEDAKDSQPLFQRGNDIIKGASTWVGGKDGQRFIALTEHADFSTLMHEFIGHATEEMKRRYPELWEAVERDMGRPLEEWTKPQHEKFAKQVERYWMEGKPPSPELATMMRMIKEWMKGVYASITALGRPMPQSTRILLNRHLGQGITARPGARTYVPHISAFDTVMDTAPGGTRLAAGGNVVGVPQVDRRNFGARRNRGILWQSGELALSARPIIDQYFRRTKFMETEAVRQELYEQGHPLPKNGRAPEGAWLVRNPDAAPERLSPRNKSRLSEEDFSRLIGEGDTPEEFVTKMEEIRKDHYAAPGEHPAWANDLENTRWVEGGKINQRISNVFPTAPRGRTAATAGSMNVLARMAGIYLRPLHYLVGNIPQNVMMVALTNPGALINSAKYGAYAFLPRTIREMAVQPRDLFAHDRHLYNMIKTETGDIQAGAGLPDFYTMANNSFQKTERRLNKISQGTAEKLGELADQPYRVSVWMGHARKYGYNTPDEWRSLLESERGTPEARIRDDIAQQTREDMIDFNTLSPKERENISRFFYLWAFTRGFAKWPVTFAREYPGRTGAVAMLSDPAATDDNGIPLGDLPASGVLKRNKAPGKIRDLTFLDPTSGLRQQLETGIGVAHGNFQGIGGMTTPPLETTLQAITGGPRAPKGGLGGLGEQLARDTVPFFDIYRKAAPSSIKGVPIPGGTPGLKMSERVKRVLEADRFSIKDEIGKGKNAEKKRREDEKIRKLLTKADRLDMLAQVMHSQDAYWHHKYLEQQIRFGAVARRKGTALNDKEKMTILYATAADYFPQADLAPLSEVLKADPAQQKQYRDELRDAMFGLRNEATK